MRIGRSKHTEVIVTDQPSNGNAHHEFIVRKTRGHDELCKVHFQKGPIKEDGVNGVTNENLLTMVICRLHGFQAGDFACRENAIALTKLEEAMLWLHERTVIREARGVEGTRII